MNNVNKTEILFCNIIICICNIILLHMHHIYKSHTVNNKDNPNLFHDTKILKLRTSMCSIVMFC